MEAIDVLKTGLEVASALVVCIGVPFAIFQLIIQRQQQHRDFENLYVQRYWSIMDQFSADYRLRGKRDNLSDNDLLACHSYLQLCEDEADLYECGRITNGTWSIWKSGIDWMLEQDLFRRVLEASESDQYVTLRRYIANSRLAPKYRGTKAALLGL